MKYKLIAADFDGTLYDGDTPGISEENAGAIKEYIALGGKFVIATGRMFCSIRPFADKLGLKDEIITYQGASIYNLSTNELLKLATMSSNDAIEILKYIESFGYHCQMYYNDLYYINSENEFSRTYCKYCGINFNLTNMPLSEYVGINKINPIKLMVILSTKEEMTEFNKNIVFKYGGKYGFARSGEKFLEIININANKGIALKYLADKYNIKREEIVAIGDSTNDISMVKFAGLGIAVANSMDELKEEADYIADFANNNAVAKIIQKIIKEQI